MYTCFKQQPAVHSLNAQLECMSTVDGLCRLCRKLSVRFTFLSTSRSRSWVASSVWPDCWQIRRFSTLVPHSSTGPPCISFQVLTSHLGAGYIYTNAGLGGLTTAELGAMCCRRPPAELFFKARSQLAGEHSWLEPALSAIIDSMVRQSGVQGSVTRTCKMRAASCIHK